MSLYWTIPSLACTRRKYIFLLLYNVTYIQLLTSSYLLRSSLAYCLSVVREESVVVSVVDSVGWVALGETLAGRFTVCVIVSAEDLGEVSALVNDGVCPTARASGGSVPVVPAEVHDTVLAGVYIRVSAALCARAVVGPSGWVSLQAVECGESDRVTAAREGTVPGGLERASGWVRSKVAGGPGSKSGPSGDSSVVGALAGRRAVGSVRGTLLEAAGSVTSVRGSAEVVRGKTAGGSETACETSSSGGGDLGFDGGQGAVCLNSGEEVGRREGEFTGSDAGKVVVKSDIMGNVNGCTGLEHSESGGVVGLRCDFWCVTNDYTSEVR
jgi:hypothetical protein